MQNLAAICVSHRGMSVEATRLLTALASSGARIQVDNGSVDLCWSRNRAINDALLHESTETLLLLDDDIVASPQQVVQLVGSIPENYAASSGVYVRADGIECAWPLSESRWHVGLGFCAVKTSALRAAKKYLPEYVMGDGVKHTAYCQAGPHPVMGHWMIDDESFCRNLLPVGGVHLNAHVKVGHRKVVVLRPEGFK